MQYADMHMFGICSDGGSDGQIFTRPGFRAADFHAADYRVVA
jgi:hypothetical protein